MREQELYNKYSKDKHWEKHPTLYAESFINFLKKTSFDGSIVDIGCGNGRDVSRFNKAGFNVLGIDISEEEINDAKKNFPNIKFDIQNVEKLKFKDNSIDAYFMINVIHYTNKVKALSEIFRTLKKDGYLFIHFNLSIIDEYRKLDYLYEESDIIKLVSKFKIINKNIFERIDKKPVKHIHKIMELILQKP